LPKWSFESTGEGETGIFRISSEKSVQARCTSWTTFATTPLSMPSHGDDDDDDAIQVLDSTSFLQDFENYRRKCWSLFKNWLQHNANDFGIEVVDARMQLETASR
jgi:hypothetical protein